MPRTHGYAVRGKPCIGTQDWNAKGRTNVIGALLKKKFVSCWLCHCNIDSEVFHQWVTTDLLKNLSPSTVVVMDNAAFHKRTDTKQAIIEAGHSLEYLPPYSPDLNPIEHKWAQAKKIRRKTKHSIYDILANLF